MPFRASKGNPPRKFPSRIELLEAAHDYRCRGWTVLPILDGTKIAAVPWKRYQTHQPTQRLIRRWFASEGVSGIAVLAGRASGGLAIRDFDTEVSYQEWSDAHNDLANVLPTVRTHRGYHVYCRSATERFADPMDGEFRADNVHYCLLPPSVHPEGGSYTWTVPLTPDIPLLDPVQVGLLPPSPAPPINLLCVLSPKPIRNTAEIIRATMPTAQGQRHRRLFDLARHLKGVSGLDSVSDAEPILREWWRQAKPVVRTKAWETSWQDFRNAWELIRHPVGVTLAGIEDRVWKIIPDKSDESNLLRLELFIEALSERHKGKPFPLSCRIAARVAGVSFKWASQLLGRLERAGIIERTAEGDRLKKLAREWRYTGPQILSMAGGEIDGTTEKEAEGRTETVDREEGCQRQSGASGA